MRPVDTHTHTRIYIIFLRRKDINLRTNKSINSRPSFVFSSVQYYTVSTFTTSTICIISTRKSSKSLPLGQASSLYTYEAGRMIPGILFSGSPGNMRREPCRGASERVRGIISALIILPFV